MNAPLRLRLLIVALTTCAATSGGCKRHAPDEARPMTVAEAHAQLDALEAKVLDPNAMFSVKATRGSLDAVLRALAPTEARSMATIRALYLEALIARKADNPAAVLDAGVACAALEKEVGNLPEPRRVQLLGYVAEAASDEREYPTAVDFFQQAVDLAPTVPELSADVRLGLREGLASSLHEVHRFEEARTLNTAVLHDGEALFGADSPKLTTVLNNLAQNDYELGQLDEAKAALERRLSLAAKADDTPLQLDTLWQLGTLAGERRDLTEARARFSQQRDLARTAGDAEEQTRAEDGLARIASGDIPHYRPNDAGVTAFP